MSLLRGPCLFYAVRMRSAGLSAALAYLAPKAFYAAAVARVLQGKRSAALAADASESSCARAARAQQELAVADDPRASLIPSGL